MENTAKSETKIKRQVNRYLRTPGTNAAKSFGTGTEPQVSPLQFSHGVYDQQRVPSYTRHPTTLPKLKVPEDDEEQDPQQLQQVRQSL